MFPCSFNIPGHSGTAFKHRKPFQKLKEHLNKKKRTASTPGKVNSTAHFIKKNYPSFSKNSVDRSLKWVVAIICLTLFLLIFLLAKNIVKSFYTDLTTISKESEEIIAKRLQDSYDFLIISGDGYLHWNMLDEAQREFDRALKIDKDGLEANLGMAKTLLKKCAQNGEYCRKAEDYSNYIKKIKEVADNELIELQEIFVAH